MATKNKAGIAGPCALADAALVQARNAEAGVALVRTELATLRHNLKIGLEHVDDLAHAAKRDAFVALVVGGVALYVCYCLIVSTDALAQAVLPKAP